MSETRQYLLERIDDAAVIQIYADGFSTLPLGDKILVWHLYLVALAGRDTIQVPAGTYTLTIAPVGDNTDETGDLDVTAPASVLGVGSGSVVLDGGQPAPGSGPEATALDRLIECMGGG